MENKRIIISIEREYGSGGHVIGEELASRFNLPLYDAELVRKLAQEKGLDEEYLKQYDEKPRGKLFTRSVRGYSNSKEDAVAYMEFNAIRELADNGESFVLVGRCGDAVLSGYEGLVTLFILGDKEKRIERIMERNQLDHDDAEKLVNETDRKRRAYHNSYADTKWGEASNYDLTINSSRLGVDGTIDALTHYIQLRCGE